MARPKDSRYPPYARHRIMHRLFELHARFGNWELMAGLVTDVKGVRFSRTDFNRIWKGTAGDTIFDRALEWIETMEPEFRGRLDPDAIFAEMGVSSRDYYFNLFTMADLDEWDESLLRQFEGVYCCAPEEDAHSYLPSPFVRERLMMPSAQKANWRQRSVDIREYIAKRSYLILRRTSGQYFHAAEVPLGALFPASFQSLDIMPFYEGIGIASSNSIHVFLRECLSRAPKIHSILISAKAGHKINPFAGALLYAGAIREMEADRQALSPAMTNHFLQEFADPIASDYYMRGTSQVSVSPVAWSKPSINTVFGTEQIYHRKPADFLRRPETHFIMPELEISREIERLISNPLAAKDFA
jgi:hypothetical protein